MEGSQVSNIFDHSQHPYSKLKLNDGHYLDGTKYECFYKKFFVRARIQNVKLADTGIPVCRIAFICQSIQYW